LHRVGQAGMPIIIVCIEVKEDVNVQEGFLLPMKSMRATHMEGLGWDSLVQDSQIPTDQHMLLIVKLQKIHDNISPRFWEEELDKIELSINKAEG